MKKVLFGIAIAAVVAFVLGTAGFVYAQSTTPATPVPGTGYGTMMGTGGRGMRSGMMGNSAGIANQDGIMHDEMIAAFSQKLGISVEDLNARLTAGETMAQIASSKGLTAEQFTTLMTDARSQAVDQAVKNGTLTQVQADWMKQHGAGQMGGNGQMSGGRGMRGSGQGQFSNPNCPYVQTNP